MKTRETGVAIVLAIGVVALAALAATAIIASQGTWSRQVELSDDHAQAQRMARVGLDWARAVLGDDGRSSQVDHLGEPWALRLPPMPTENGSLSGHIEDQQGKFNLNNLLNQGKVNVLELDKFRRLLAVLSLPPSLADTLADWLDADGELQPGGGAEDAYYLSRQPAYLAANQPLTELGELVLVRGFDSEARARLRPFVTALPRATPVNVNTVSPEVLAAIVEGLDLDEARTVLAQRDRSFFRQVSEFTAALPSGRSIAAEHLSVNSDYFLATMSVSFGETTAQGSALLARTSAGWPEVVWWKAP